MRALVQRVASARVRIDDVVVGAIDTGLCVFLGWLDGDTEQDEDWIGGRLVSLRIFNDRTGKMNRSLADLQDEEAGSGSLLLVSQFTLAADLVPGLAKGSRPSFSRAMKPDLARGKFDSFCGRMERLFAGPVARGVFAADMKVELINDGPVTLWLDSRGGRQELTP